MPKENDEKKPSAYDQIAGLSEANRPSGGDRIKSTIKSLGFQDQQQALTPTPEKSKGPVSPVKNQYLRNKLAQHLVASGRSDGVKKDGKLGGALSDTAKEKREQHSATILQGMENATIDYQKSQGQTNLAHPYSAHGPGSDQVGRLLDGHRADEKVTGVKGKTFTGNGAVGTFKGKDHKTVGSAPTNTSGAFSSNFGMLSAVQEGFAQAGMLDSYVSRTKGINKSDQGRISTTVKGTGESIGYNLEVPNTVKQSKGMPLAHDEMESRYKSITRDDSLTHANMVLDPVNDKNGHRMGWTLQTAYATKEDKTADLYSKPTDVRFKGHALNGKVAYLKKEIAKDEKRISELETGNSELIKKYGNAQNRAKGMQNNVNKVQKELEELVKSGADTNAIDAKTKDLESAKLRFQTAESERLKLETEYKEKAEKPLELAKRQLAEHQKELKSAELAAKNYRQKKKGQNPTTTTDEEEGEGEGEGGGGGGGGAKEAGYNPLLGKWTGERPEKPQEYADQLKGKDKDDKPLTAHHLYPWNKIVADLNAALQSKDESGMRQIFAFGGITGDANFWEELKKDPQDRNYAFSETLNNAVPRICWAPANIMMGPGARKDDPGEEIDAKVSGGLGGMTDQSVLAELMSKQGGIHKSGLGAMYLRNLRERDEGVGPAAKYDPKDWGQDGTGKDAKPFLLKNGVSEKDGKMLDERKKWVTAPNAKHDENEKNPNLGPNLTGKVPTLANPKNPNHAKHFEAKGKMAPPKTTAPKTTAPKTTPPKTGGKNPPKTTAPVTPKTTPKTKKDKKGGPP